MPPALDIEPHTKGRLPFAKVAGVEYVYSVTNTGLSMAVVRFYVGERLEDSLVKLYNKLYSHFDLIPPGASRPLVKPRSIDDVPILALTLWSEREDHYTLRRLAAQLDEQIKDVPDVSETRIIGGQRRQIKVLMDPARMAATHVDPGSVVSAREGGNRELRVGSFAAGNREHLVDVGDFLRGAPDVGRVVVGVFQGRPISLDDVARVEDGPEEPTDYVLFNAGLGAARKGIRREREAFPAVTISVAKRKGTNAVVTAERVLEKVRDLRGRLLPDDVHVTVTRNYGETAKAKSTELLRHVTLATVSVTALIALFLGVRASLVVLIAIPVTLALTLFLYYLYGYTLNRVTLFALIFSIGILVDDAIVVVENIARHYALPESRHRPLRDVTVEAVAEVGNPTVLATWAVIGAILPMAFVGGLMGPYMRPIPVGASVAMLFSLLIAFIVSPWAAYRFLRRAAGDAGGTHAGHTEDWTTRLSRRLMAPLLRSGLSRAAFFGLTLGLLVAACSLVALKVVRVKMLPFDNKSEFQVIVDMPEGSTLEETARVTHEIGRYLGTVPEVTDYETYVGTASPHNFNGLVRHYFLRRGPNVADIQVNLLPKDERRAQSHEIATRVRPPIDAIGRPAGARIKVAEVPPGPPVLETLVAEVYGPSYPGQIELAGRIRDLFERTPGVVDVDWSVEDPQPRYRFVVNKTKAALNGVSTDRVVQALRAAVGGTEVGLAHLPLEKEDVPLFVRLPRRSRSSVGDLESIQLGSPGGTLVPLSDLARVEQDRQEPAVYRKNLKPVVYVTADVAGVEDSPAYAMLKMSTPLAALRAPDAGPVARHWARQPFLTAHYAMKWDGEWQVTYEVFRDLGLAFAVVLGLIYVLIVGWFQSFRTPLVIMAPIPLTLVGILPAHWLVGAFFTATSMIGFIAGAGIIVRNSIILVDFIELRRAQGMPLAEAVIDAGTVRFRPMLLTASAVVVGASVMLFDPIFQGLALSLMAGEVASTALSRMAVPVLYYLSERRHAGPASTAMAPLVPERALGEEIDYASHR